MLETRPFFPYYPTAYTDGTITEKSITCDCCNQSRQHSYEGGIYTASRQKPRFLCAWCVESGNAAARYDGSFQEADFSLTASALSTGTVITRTPTVSVWNPIDWPDQCGECCAYLGRFDASVNGPLLDTSSIQFDLNDISERIRMPVTEVLEWNQRNTIHLRHFQCFICNANRIALDLD